MKTIFRTNRPQNKDIGFSLLLLIAVFGLFIGGVKPPMSEVAKTSIGGNGTVVVPAPTPVVLTSSTDIGGQHVPRDTNPLGYVSSAEIGGQRVSGDINPIGFNATAEIGGDNQQKPKEPNPLGLSFEIGGQKVPPSSPMGTGGNQGAPQSPGLPYLFSNSQIGGNGVPARTLPVVGLEQQGDFQIEGNNSVPQPRLPISRSSYHSMCNRGNSVYDYNQDSGFIDQEEFGGGQTAPREVLDISVGNKAHHDLN